MSKKETFDKMFDALLDEAIETIESQPDINLPEETELTFSAKHEERMRKLFAKERAREKRKKTFKNIQRMAACFLALILVSGVTVMSVDALRVRFLNFVFDTQETNTKIVIKELGGQYSNGDVTLTYLPVEFVLTKEEIDIQKTYLKFKNESKYFYVLITGVDENKSVDTENAETEQIIVNDMQAVYSENENGNVLVMHDQEYIYTISGNIEKSEIVEIARNIRKN